ncbi:hypothetical protein DFP72DRAFT_877435 [Ephemerocybe angulata]|uniref:Uncharacterized protein n=1 Tax=Ephemerocybe angulata TaxID=980116 RepID=A0A8H6ICX1_9AGAR|nr:hypothetical protein DFP72DRAFT_877435 [Tulosesus angulatus]
MKSIVLSSFVAAALVSRAYAYIPAEEGAFDVRHFHIVERDMDGEIVDRTFVNNYNVAPRDSEDLGTSTDNNPHINLAYTTNSAS